MVDAQHARDHAREAYATALRVRLEASRDRLPLIFELLRARNVPRRLIVSIVMMLGDDHPLHTAEDPH